MIAPPPPRPPRAWTLQPEDHFEEIRARKRQVSTEFLHVDRPFVNVETPDPRSNLVAVGVGEKQTGGKSTGFLCIRLYVRKKYGRHEIRPEHLLENLIEHDGLTLDVVEVGLLEHQVSTDEPDPTLGIDPLQPGCSVSPCGCYGTTVPTGTLGPLLADSSGISCAHVLRSRCPNADDEVYYPGAADASLGGARIIGNTAAVYEAEPGKENEVDVAIVRFRPETDIDPSAMFIGPSQPPVEPDYEMAVQKYGRSSRYSRGHIYDLDFEPILVDRSWDPVRSIKYVRQIAVRPSGGQPFSAAGDSGALVLQVRTNAAVGILVGGSARVSAITPIRAVVDLTGVPLATGYNDR
jgi:hypothetical protein